MQAFTSGGVTVRVDISNMQPHFGNMTGYYCEFVWWLEIDSVEYVSGETTSTEEWWIGAAGAREGWNAEVVSGRIDNDDVPIDDDIDAVVERVLGWFGNLREDIVGAWMNTVNEYVERANEYGDCRPDPQYGVQFVGDMHHEAWAVVDARGDEVGNWWYDSKEEAETAAASMQDA